MALPLHPEEARRRARALARELAGRGARAVVFLSRGGEVPGREIAGALDLPLHALDVRYPFSRRLGRVPAPLRPLLFPFKEICYRLSSPAAAPGAGRKLPDPGPPGRLLLVDDSASSGRTLREALRVLKEEGWPRERVLVAVLRCGSRARALVDASWMEG